MMDYDLLPDREIQVGDPLLLPYQGRSPLTVVRIPALPADGPEDLLALPLGVHNLLTTPHAATDRMVPLSPGDVEARQMAIVDNCWPTASPIHNYGFPVVADQQKPPLDNFEFSYAAMDTQSIVDEVKSRISHALFGYY